MSNPESFENIVRRIVREVFAEGAQREFIVKQAIPIEPKVGETWHWDGIGEEGEMYSPRDVVIFRVDPGTAWSFCIKSISGHFLENTSREHLSPIEPFPQWKPGDWAFFEGEKSRFICKILHNLRKDGMHVTTLNGMTFTVDSNHFRPLTDSDWVGEIAGVKVRALCNEEEGVDIHRLCNDGVWRMFLETYSLSDIAIARKICADNRVPIMPFGYKEK